MHYQYISICRGGKSIIEQLEAAGINASDYIRFYSLRSHDRIKRSVVEDVLTTVEGYSAREDIEDEVEFATVGEYGSEHRHGHHRRRHHQSRTPWLSHDFVSEELYIHAKLLIADGK
jgi:phospholipase D1/2